MRATYEGGFIRDVYQGECTTSEVRGWTDEVREVRVRLGVVEVEDVF